MSVISRIFDRERIARACLILFPVTLWLLIVFSPVWMSGSSEEIKGPAGAIAAGILALIAGIILVARPRILDSRLISIFAFSFLLLAWLLSVSLINGSSISVLTGISFESGTFISFIAFVSALISGYIFSSADTGENKNRRWLIWGIATLALVGGVFVLHRYSQKNISIDSFGEARLSLDATMHTVLRTYGNEKNAALLGTGLGTFGLQWARYRPEWAGASPQWNTDFETGSGLVPTLAVTIGFPLTLFLIMLFASEWLQSASRVQRSSSETDFGAIAILAAALSLFVWFFFHTPNLPLLLIFGVLLGAMVSRGSDDNKSGEQGHITFFGRFHFRKLWAGIFAALLLSALGVTLLSSGALRYIALQSYYRGIQELTANSGNDDTAIKFFERSIKYSALPRTDRALARVYERRARTFAEEARKPPFKFGLSDSALKDAESAVDYARQATVLDNSDYRNWIELGNARVLFGTLGDKKEVSVAIDNYKHAQALSPNHPLVYLLEAQAFYLSGDKPGARKSLERALELKPDYTESIALQKRLFGTNIGE